MRCEEAIRSRRSVRRYASDRVSEDTLRSIIEAGIRAPSGLNNQPWKFKIVTDTRQKEGLAGFTKYGAIIREAPAALCVFLIQRFYTGTKILWRSARASRISCCRRPL